jgi:hypothetical protein
MKRIGALIVALWTLAGCTPGGEPTTPPGTTEPAVTPSPEVARAPTVTPSPTQQWTEEQQGAVDAVDRYRKVLDRVAQDLDNTDWEEVWDVADGEASTGMLEAWSTWQANGWHQVGSTDFVVDRVSKSITDNRGQRYRVRGCYRANGSYLANAAGERAVPGAREEGEAEYLVLLATSGEFWVVDTSLVGDTCPEGS